jgi:hypothetical protein
MNWFRGGHALSIKNVTMYRDFGPDFFNEMEFEYRLGAFCKLLKVVGRPIRADFKLFCYL